MPLPLISIILLLGTEMGLLFEPRLEIMQSDGVDQLLTSHNGMGYTAKKKRVESILDFQLICHLHSGTKCLHTWHKPLTIIVNGLCQAFLYQNVSDKSIENQELILRVFLLWYTSPLNASASFPFQRYICKDRCSISSVLFLYMKLAFAWFCSTFVPAHGTFH